MTYLKKKATSLKVKMNSNVITLAILLVLYAIFEFATKNGQISRSTSGLLVPICVYVVCAISLNLVVGFSGELSLGHAGFLSIGAFSGVIFFHLFSFVGNDVIQLILSMICAGIVSGLFGFVIGIPVLRLRGDYLAIVTLAFGEIIKNIMNCVYLGYDSNRWYFSFGSALTVEEDVVTVLNGPMGVTGNTKVSTFTIGFILVLLSFIAVINLISSKTGRAITACRDNRIAAESVGINVTKHKMIAFVTSAILTGMAGALYVMNYASVAPSKFNFNTSILILVFVVMGGIGNLRGGIIAAIILTVLPEKLRFVGDYRMLIYAVLLIVIMLATNSKKGKMMVDKVISTVKELAGKIAKGKGKNA